MAEEKKIFISQQVLDALFEENQAELKNDELIILSKNRQVFKLIPAFKFLYLAEGTHDPNQLIGKIFTEEQLKSTKADVYMDSVIYKETAYQVEPGFLGIPHTPKEGKAAEQAAEKAVEKVVEPVDAAKVEQVDDVKMLENYLLKIL